MQNVIQSALAGLGPGALEGILAMGIVLIYRTSGVLNFALGATGALGVYVVYSLAQGRSMALALLGGLILAGIAGAASYGSIYRVRSGHPALTAAIATLAVSTILEQVVRNGWAGVLSFPSTFSADLITLGPWQISRLYVAAFLTGVGLLAAITAFLRWTRVGTMVRAIADNPEGARLAGANVDLMVAAVWAGAGMLATVAGFFQAQITFDPFFLTPPFLAALIAAVLGGLRSLPIAFFGAISIEIARTLFQLYAGNIRSDLPGYAQTFLLLLLILFLLVVPRRWLGQARGRVV